MGGGGRVGGGKVKEQLSLRPVGTLVVRERMGKALAVQSGRALPMGRCASPPCTYSILNTECYVLKESLHIHYMKIVFFEINQLYSLGYGHI